MFQKISLFVLFIIPLCLFSQGSYLNISMYDESEFFIVFDNTVYAQPGNFAEVDQIPPGEHTLKITLYDASMSAMGNVVYDGKIKIPSGFDTYAVIDEYNNLNIYKKVKYGFNRIDCASETRKKCAIAEGEKYKAPEEKYSECNYKVIKKDNYDELKDDINNRSFESSNISIVKTAIDKNLFLSEQIKELLGYFTFESNKLEIAKYAYAKVCDKNNFFKVYDAFNFESSIEELKNYISGK